MAPNMAVSMVTVLGVQREVISPNIFRLVPYLTSKNFVSAQLKPQSLARTVSTWEWCCHLQLLSLIGEQYQPWSCALY